MKNYEGLAASPGIAIGQAWIFRPQTPNIDTRSITEDEIKSEYRAFRNAQAKVDAHLEALYNRVLEKQGEHEAAIFESHRELLADEELENDIQAYFMIGFYGFNSRSRMGSDGYNLFSSP